MRLFLIRFGVFLLALSFMRIGQANETWSLDDLMQTMAQVEQFEAQFEEVKDFAFFTNAVKVTGVLSYHQPNYLKREVTAPHQEVTVIEDDVIKIERARSGGGENDSTEEQQLSVDVHPAVRTLIESIRATFAGDLVVLEKYYQLSMQGEEQTWQLTLEPIDDEVREYIHKVEIFGSGREISKILTTEADQSESQITIVGMVFG